MGQEAGVHACVCMCAAGRPCLSTLGVGCVYWGLSFLVCEMGRSLSSASLTGQCEDGLPCQGCGSVTSHALVRAASGCPPALTVPPMGCLKIGVGESSLSSEGTAWLGVPLSTPAGAVLHGPSSSVSWMKGPRGRRPLPETAAPHGVMIQLPHHARPMPRRCQHLLSALRGPHSPEMGSASCFPISEMQRPRREVNTLAQGPAALSGGAGARSQV